MALQNEISLGRDCLHSVGHNLNTLIQMKPSCAKNMNFKEFCSAAISVYQLEAPENCYKIATNAFLYFEQEGNRVITVEELTKVSLSCSRLHSSIQLLHIHTVSKNSLAKISSRHGK